VIAGRRRGFTLLEILVVVAIVSLLMVLLVPSYQVQLHAMRRALACAALQEAMLRQEQFFLENKRYAERLIELDYPGHPYAIDREGSPVSDHAQDRTYLIELVTDGHSYMLSATPQLSQSADRACGTLSLDSAGTKRVSGDRAVRECW
jgi:type IV pilus assembly protein PilE